MNYYAVGESLLSGYLLALARMAGFVLVAPPFNTRGIPGQARVAFAVAMAIPLSTWTIPDAPGLDSGDTIMGMLVELISGAGITFRVASLTVLL